jgi:hypothetical protein
MELEIFVSIIVRKLFTRLDCTDGEDVKATAMEPHLAVGSARVVDEASDVLRNVSVDHRRVARPEQILPAIVTLLFDCGGATDVFDDE